MRPEPSRIGIRGPGHNTTLFLCAALVVESRLYLAAGLPSYEVRFARVNVNGGYYHYMMEPEDIDATMLAKFTPKGEKVGDIYKCDGYRFDQANQGVGDGRVLTPYCGFTAPERYAVTYKRVNNDWKDQADIMKLVADLNAARASGGAVRAYLEKNFDVPRMLTTYAIRSWAAAWDDTVHNYFPYRRAGDGKWIFIQQDFDQEVGLLDPATTSLYRGTEGDPDNKANYSFNRWKDAILKEYRLDYEQRLRDLVKTVLAPQAVLQIVDEGAAAFNLDDWNQAPAAKACDVPAAIEKIRAWARDRAAFINQRLP